MRRYTRSNPNLNPPFIVDDPHRIGKKPRKFIDKFNATKEQLTEKTSEVFIPHVHSLPERLDTLQDIEFDIHFEKSLFRNKSLSWLGQIVFDSSISLENLVEDFFTQTKSGSQLIHALDQLQNFTSNIDI